MRNFIVGDGGAGNSISITQKVMFEKLMTRLTFILFVMTVLMAVANNAHANGIYISQVGDGADIEIGPKMVTITCEQ